MSNLDEMLRDLLQKNPSLMKQVQKMVGENPGSPAGRPSQNKAQGVPHFTGSQPKKFKRPSPDYRLIVTNGCETCQHISDVGYEMSWDEEKRLFRPIKERTEEQKKKAFTKTERQFTTTTTCPWCVETLSSLPIEKIVSLLLLLQNPTETTQRLIAFKQLLRSRTSSAHTTPVDVQKPADAGGNNSAL